jgi:chromosome segregation ATPase
MAELASEWQTYESQIAEIKEECALVDGRYLSQSEELADVEERLREVEAKTAN